MSMAYECNRCGTHHKHDKNHKITAHGREKRGIGFVGPITYYDEEYDLCPECKAEFDDFMNGVPAPTLFERLKERLKKKE